MKMQIIMMWRKFFINIADNKEFLDNYCDKTNNKLRRAYPPWYLYNRNALGIVIPNSEYPHEWIIHA